MDRLKDIFGLLNSIRAQSYPPAETIFVIQGSNDLFDRLSAYVKESAVPNVRVIFDDEGMGASAARNIGIRGARGDIIAFVDDDTLLFRDWAEEMVKTYMQDDSVVGVAGAALPLWEDDSMSWFPEEFHWIISCTSWVDDTGIRETRNAWTMNSSIKKEALGIASLFDTSLGPWGGNVGGYWALAEDIELSMRVIKNTRKRIVYNPKVRVSHKVYQPRIGWRNIVRCAYWIGLSRHMLKRLYPKDEMSSSPLRTEYRLVRRIFYRLLPSIVKGYLRDPVVSCRRLLVAFVALLSTALGYYSHLFDK